MRPKSQLRDPFAYGNRRGTLCAWTMAVVFATVAALSFAVDQTITLSPGAEAKDETNPLSLLHPVQLIRSLIDAASQ